MIRKWSVKLFLVPAKLLGSIENFSSLFEFLTRIKAKIKVNSCWWESIIVFYKNILTQPKIPKQIPRSLLNFTLDFMSTLICCPHDKLPKLHYGKKRKIFFIATWNFNIFPFEDVLEVVRCRWMGLLTVMMRERLTENYFQSNPLTTPGVMAKTWERVWDPLKILVYAKNHRSAGVFYSQRL